MRFKIKKDEFLKGLSRVQSVADRKNTMPILSNVLIEAAEGGALTLTATDLEIGLRGVYQAEVEEPGGVALSARKLFEIVRELPQEEVSFETTESNWAVIKSGAAVFKFSGLPKEEFPSLPVEDAPFIAVDAQAMRDLIKKTIFAAGENDTRYVLNGIYMVVAPEEGGTTVQMVGTDGHRLAVLRKKMDGVQGQAGTAIIPKKSAAELKKLLDEDEGDLQMSMSKNHIVFKLDGLYMVTRLIEGSYPNYEQVIPQGNDRKVGVEKGALASALKRVSLLSRERTNAVKFSFAEGVAELSSQNPEMGEAKEDLPIAFTGEGIEIGFNAKYILDALSVMEDDSVQMLLKDGLAPCVICPAEGDDYRCVVMPMRV